MINNEAMVSELEEALVREANAKNRTLYKPNRFHVSVQLKELFNKNVSVVFIYKITGKYAQLSFCHPLTAKQRRQFDSAGYVPLLRSEKYMKVGTDLCMGIDYAYTQIRFPLDSGGIDFIDAMRFLHKEMENYLNRGEQL